MCSRASDFGLMKIDEKGRVLFFSEKPKGNDLKAMVALIAQKLYSLRFLNLGRLCANEW